MTFNRSWHQSGTASINNAETVVTGQLSTWSSSGIREGDYFYAAGYIVPIASVNSNTSITLADAWPGSNRTTAAYKIIPATDAVRTVVASRSVLDLLLDGKVDAFAGLTGAANKVPYFTGVSSLDVADFTAAGRAIVGAADAGAQQTAIGMSTYFKTLIAASTASALQILLGVREVLTANRTYYVRSDGNNSNTGLADTAGGAFLTLQGAYDKIRASIDFAGKTVTIQVRSGTYAPLNISADWVGGGSLIIVGDTTTPTNCHISSSTAHSIWVTAPINSPIIVGGFQMTFNGSSLGGVVVSSRAQVSVSNIQFNGGATGYMGAMSTTHRNGVIIITGSITMAGNVPSLFFLSGGQIYDSQLLTITLTGTPAFSFVTAYLIMFADLSLRYTTFSGSATGTRYSVGTNSIIRTNGAGTSYLPGNAAGSTETQGQYT